MLTQTGSKTTDRDLFWHFPNNWGPTGPGIGATSTIRNGDWKLIYYYRDSHFELFNIHEDISELNNLAETNPDKLKELADRLGKYLKRVDAQRPSYKNSGELVPFPDGVI